MLREYINKLLNSLDLNIEIPENENIFLYLIRSITQYIGENGFKLLVGISIVYFFSNIIKKLFFILFLSVSLITVFVRINVKGRIRDFFGVEKLERK